MNSTVGNGKQMHLIGGSSHPELTAALAKELKIKPCEVRINQFANGEISVKLGESIRNDDVFVMQTHSRNVNDAIMEQAIIIDTCKRSSAASITAVVPSLGYARQDRKSSGREPITARLVVDILTAAGADRIVSVDLHAGQIQGFFSGPFDHLTGLPILEEYAKEHFGLEDLVIVAPDAGRVKATERFSTALGCSMAIIHKQRSYVKHNTVEAKYLIGDVKGKHCIIIDDMIDTAGTICAAATILEENGALDIYGMATHGVLSDPAIERIEAAPFKKVVITDTLPLPKKSDKIEVLPIAPLLARAIEAIYQGDSVSALFKGKNQS
jgi:ribose-phosphate pyrophosphokinase